MFCFVLLVVPAPMALTDHVARLPLQQVPRKQVGKQLAASSQAASGCGKPVPDWAFTHQNGVLVHRPVTFGKQTESCVSHC